MRYITIILFTFLLINLSVAQQPIKVDKKGQEIKTPSEDTPLYNSILESIENGEFLTSSGTLKVLTKEPLPEIKWGTNYIHLFYAKTGKTATGIYLSLSSSIVTSSTHNMFFYIDDDNALPLSFKDTKVYESIDYSNITSHNSVSVGHDFVNGFRFVSPKTGMKITYMPPIIDGIVYNSSRNEGNIIGDNIVIADIDRTRFVWHTFSQKDESWDTFILPISKNKFLDLFLPEHLKEYVSATNSYFRMYKAHSDGNIIFNYTITLKKGDESANIDMLIRQPKEGDAELLTWLLRYGPSSRDTKLSKMFFPAEDGEIESVMCNYDFPYELDPFGNLLFDIDASSNSILFLRTGQVCRLILDD